MLNLNDARFFVRVVEHGGFTPAARALGLPKSTVSKRVAELELALGTPLLHRTSRAFALTPVGQEFHQRAAAMVALAEDAEAAVHGLLTEPTGTVRITSSVPDAQTWLADALPKIAAAHPKVQIALHATDRYVDVLGEGFDIAIRSHADTLADSDLRARTLGRDAFVLVAAPRYLKQHGMPKHPRDLGAHDAALARPSSTSLALTHENGERVTVTPRPRFLADEAHVLLAAARASLGFTVMPRGLCHGDLESGALRRVLPKWTAGSVTTTLLMPERRARIPAVRAVADALASHFGVRDA
jgi:DNA-binding transcriptional LysR family regulator